LTLARRERLIILLLECDILSYSVEADGIVLMNVVACGCFSTRFLGEAMDSCLKQIKTGKSNQSLREK